VLPDLSVFWVIFFVMLLTVIIDRLLLRPVMRVMNERERATRSARELAERSANQARAAAA
jgi:F0F1-type ATP synthase membrane subunit b/b'